MYEYVSSLIWKLMFSWNTPQVHMMFEVQDLSQASPATVSRCGMVYIDANTLGWKPYVKSWLNRLFDKISLIKLEFEDKIWALFEEYMDPGLQFVRKYCAPAIHQVRDFRNNRGNSSNYSLLAQIFVLF